MYKQLTLEQRSQIFALLQKKTSKKDIAAIIGRSLSTVYREIRRNSTPSGHYLYKKAQGMAMARRRRSTENHALDPQVVWRVKELIVNEQWSPRQISGYLGKRSVKVSHTTIYNIIHADKTGRLALNCRHALKHRRRPSNRFPIAGRVSIHERPAEADGRRFGDWEMDLIVDPAQRAILTLVERSTNMLLMRKLPHGKQSGPLARAVYALLLPYKGSLKTITTDNGPEFAAHKDITRLLGVPVYFADPYSAWQKGAVENANGLIRQYFPKGMNFDKITDRKVMSVQKKLNLRPRRKLNFSCPKTEFFKNIAKFAVAS